MNRSRFFSLIGLLSAALFFGACSSDDNPTEPDGGGTGENTEKYIVMTVSDRTQQYGGGYISSFDTFPTGNFSNVTSKSLNATRGAAGWRIYKNWIFKMFRSADATQGIEKVEIAKDGTVTSGKFLTSKTPTEAAKHYGTGNFVINNETSGFYWDGAEPLKIQKFNPTTMENTGSIDLTELVNSKEDADNAAIKFKSVGQKFLAVKNGKLFANIGYGTVETAQAGFFDDYFPDIDIAVIDIATEKLEKTTIKDAGAIAYINENPMYDFDSNGDLYIVTQGGQKKPIQQRSLGGDSKIVRIKANEDIIDTSWELKFADSKTSVGDNGKFVNVYANNGKLIVLLNNTPLTGGPSGNINSADIWEFYAVDVTSKDFKKISGIAVGSNPGAALAVTEVDNKILLRGSTANSSVNGYFEYDPATNSAKQLFNITEGGAVSGFAKITVQ